MNRPLQRGWFALWLIPLLSVVALSWTGNSWFLYGVTLGALVFGGVCLWKASPSTRRAALLLWSGLAATMTGDYFLAIGHASVNSKEFLYGIGGFTLMHTLWLAFFIRQGKVNLYAAAILLLAFGGFYGKYLFHSFPTSYEVEYRVAVGLYGALSCLNLSFALGSPLAGRAWLAAGIGMLMLSDTLIALGSFLYVGVGRGWVGPTYVASLILVAVGASCFTRSSSNRKETEEVERG